jgi:hypothetical protein
MMTTQQQQQRSVVLRTISPTGANRREQAEAAARHPGVDEGSIASILASYSGHGASGSSVMAAVWQQQQQLGVTTTPEEGGCYVCREPSYVEAADETLRRCEALHQVWVAARALQHMQRYAARCKAVRGFVSGDSLLPSLRPPPRPSQMGGRRRGGADAVVGRCAHTGAEALGRDGGRGIPGLAALARAVGGADLPAV